MKKTYSIKYVVYAVVFAVLFVPFSGCSRISIFNLMDSEQRGEFSLSVETVYVKTGSQYKISPEGGFSPYYYAMISGAGTIEKDTGLYSAPSSTTKAQVEAIDQLSSSDYATVWVYAAIVANPNGFSIHLDDGVQNIGLTGGAGELSVSAERGTLDVATISSGDSVAYTPPAVVGTDYVYVVDEQGNSLSIKVDVLPTNVALEILPSYTLLKPNNTEVFDITNNTGNDLTLALTNAFGTINKTNISGGVTKETVSYTAPAETGAVFLTVEDTLGGITRQADIYVQDVVTPLEITPSVAEVSPGSTVEFTASGGVPPYSFSRINGTGTLVQTSPTTANYSPESQFSMMRVTDKVENRAEVKIKVK